MKKYYFIAAFVLICFACTNKTEKAKTEIVQTEKEFAQYAIDHSVVEAFVKYADDSAVISRNNTVLCGKSEIERFYSNPYFKNITITWSPDFVEVAASADLGYTYGHFTHSSVDSTGKVSEFKGIFHTVWKKQNDGSWRFLWD